MELRQASYEQVISDLLDQNTTLRYELAALKATLKSLSEELDIQKQMQNSRNIPPEVWDVISKLDIR